MKKMTVLILLIIFIIQCQAQTGSTADEIIKLKKLYDQGVLTKEEFDNQKAKLLNSSSSPNGNNKLNQFNNSENANNISIPESEFSGSAVYVKTNSEGIPLESIRMSLKSKTSTAKKLLGIGKVRQSATVTGKHSAVVLPYKPILKFIYTCNDNNENPNNIIQLYRFEIKDNNREVEVESMDSWGQTTQGADSYVSFNAKKYGNNSYLIEVRDLPRGEYGFTYFKGELKATSVVINTFAVE